MTGVYYRPKYDDIVEIFHEYFYEDCEFNGGLRMRIGVLDFTVAIRISEEEIKKELIYIGEV